jgi:hypothetical protein
MAWRVPPLGSPFCFQQMRKRALIFFGDRLPEDLLAITCHQFQNRRILLFGAKRRLASDGISARVPARAGLADCLFL